MLRAVLAFTLAVSTAASAQAVPGSLAGFVVDAATQTPLADAQVTARSPALAGEQSVTSDANGHFEMTFLPPGVYMLSVRRDGYQPFAPEGLMLKGKKVHIRLAVVATPPPPNLANTAVEFNDSMT